MAEIVDIERGLRLRAIRDELEMTQEELAVALTGAAKRLGLPLRYDGLDVSKRETARKTLDPEDYAVIALIDPQRRGWLWVAFGQTITLGKDAWETLAGPKNAAGGSGATGSPRGGGRS